jgi:hypothetical protein
MMDVGSFIRQMAPFLILWIALPMILMVLYFAVIKPRLKKRRAEKMAEMGIVPETPARTTSALDMLRQARPNEAAAPRTYDTGDLPDLDTLLNTPIKPNAASARPALREIPPEPQQLRLNTGRVTAAKELLTVLRDENDGRLMVQIGATGYRTLVETPAAKKIFSSLMKELGSIILTPDTVVDEEPAMPDNLMDDTPDDMPDIGDLARAQAVEAAPEPMPEPTPVKKSAPPPRLADGSIPGQLPSYRLDDHPSKVEFNRVGMVKKVDYVPAPDLDIPSAIEAYLQYKIQHNPDFQGREIHVVPSVGGGVRIQVGKNFYDGVDEVADPGVKHFIKEAIAEWQELS